MDRPFSDYRLPRGRHGLPRDFVTANQRWRLLGATAEAFAEHGYARLSTAAIASVAGVSRSTVYEHFDNVDACLLAAYRVAAECVIDLVAGICEERLDRPQRLPAALDAALSFAAAEPALARLLGLEPLAAVAVIAPERERLLERLTELLRATFAVDVAGWPPGVSERLTAIAIAFAVDRIRAGEADRLPGLAPELVEILAAPYVGGRESSSRAM